MSETVFWGGGSPREVLPPSFWPLFGVLWRDIFGTLQPSTQKTSYKESRKIRKKKAKPNNKAKYQRGLFTGEISRISKISKFSRISRIWPDSPLFFIVWVSLNSLESLKL